MRHFIHYYGIYVLIGCGLTAMTVFFFLDFRRERGDEKLFVLVSGFEAESGGTKEFQLSLAEAMGIEEGECIVDVGAAGAGNASSEAVTLAYIGSGRVDILIADEKIFNRYAVSGSMKPIDGPGQSGDGGFYACERDYGTGGAVTELPFAPHDDTKGTRYGFYLEKGPLAGYVAGIPKNSPHSSYAQEALGFIRAPA